MATVDQYSACVRPVRRDFFRWRYLLAALASILLGSLPAAAGTVFVDWRNSGFQDGTAAHPFQTLPPALAVAAPGDTIAIRTGSYGLDGGPLVFNKSATVRADNGLVTIGIPPPVRVSGPADIDFAGCAPVGTHGTVSHDYWVIREPSVSGPLNVALEGLPADVTGTVDPQTLLFPGNVISQRVNVTLTTIAGPTVPDTFVTLHITGDGIDMPFGILLHGACPQQNRNFVQTSPAFGPLTPSTSPIAEGSLK